MTEICAVSLHPGVAFVIWNNNDDDDDKASTKKMILFNTRIWEIFLFICT